MASALRAEDLFATQGGAGAHNGSSVANAWSAAEFNTSGNWGAGAGKISAGDTVYLSGTFTTQLSVKGSGTNASTRITLTDTAALPATLVGITGSAVSFIAVIGLEFTQPLTSSTFVCIGTLSGSSGWLIEDNYFHDTFCGAIELKSTNCNNNIVRHNTFNNICWTGLGSAANGGNQVNTITFGGDSNLVEYNTLGVTLDRVYAGSGTGNVVRNNTFTHTDASLFLNTNPPTYPWHNDTAQGAINLTKSLFDKNWDIDNLEPIGGNAHNFLFQDYSATNTVNWIVHRFNVTIRNGGVYLGNIQQFYDYNCTYIGINFSAPSPTPAEAYAWILVGKPDSNFIYFQNCTWSLSPKLKTTGSGIFNTTDAHYPATISYAYMHSWNSGSTGGLIPSGTGNLAHVEPLFTNSAGDDYTIQSGSPLRSAAGAMTTASGAGVASTALTVADAKYLFDGWSIADADFIKIGAGGSYVQITSINYGTNVVTLSAARTWSSGDGVWVKGAEDVGAQPYSYVSTIGVTNTSTATFPAGAKTLTATVPSTDAIRMVEFLIDGQPVSIDYASPFTASWTSNGAKHTLVTRAYNAWAAAQNSVDQTLTTDNPTMGSPNATSSTAITVPWTDNSGGTSVFSIEISTDGTNFSVLDTTAAGATSYPATGLTPATLYYFRLRAFGGGIYSTYSATGSATTNAPPSTATGNISPSRRAPQTLP